jgi:flagellin-like hook-associated protein FlgL
MSRIIPIPTTRVGDFFVRQRLTSQVQGDQLELFRLQSQVSTGQRLQLPSDDAPAALRAITLQGLLDRKGHIQTNLQSSNFYLSSAEGALNTVPGELARLRGEVIGTASTVATDAERQAAVQQLDGTLQYLFETANSKAQGRYLFSGSRSATQPYEYRGQFVEYKGNEGDLRSYVDLERLFETNLPGTDVFGGISTPVQGSVDLDPQLSADTLLSTINGGAGIGKNAAITLRTAVGGNPAVTTVIDLSTAVTVGEVARMIEAAAPPDADVTVDITGSGLVVESASGTLAVAEVAQGRAAHELGIFTGTASPASSIVGSDLNPALLKTSRLSDLLGTKSQGRLISADPNNDITLIAAENGADFNGVTVEFVAGVVAGSESASYDSNTKTLTVQIEDGVSTAEQVATAITNEGTFNASADYRDATSATLAGFMPVQVANFGVVTSGGSGEVLDTSSGLILTNGGDSVSLDISGAETVEDLLNLIRGTNLGLATEINASATGINLRSRLSGADLTIGENGGTTATQLGIRSYTGETELAEFNRGLGVLTANDPANNDLLITARDGTQLAINLSAADTVQDVIDLINGNAANNTGTTAVLARLAVTGNGIELVDSSTATTGDLTIAAVEGSQAAALLGFLPAGQTQVSTNTADPDGNFVLASEDRHTLETDSVFNSLLRLRAALEAGDPPAIGRELDRLDAATGRVNFARAEIGTRIQNLAVVDNRLKDENIQLRAALSDDLDVDLVEAISNLTARQYAFEASLRTAASLLQTTLLNYI